MGVLILRLQIPDWCDWELLMAISVFIFDIFCILSFARSISCRKPSYNPISISIRRSHIRTASISIPVSACRFFVFRWSAHDWISWFGYLIAQPAVWPTSEPPYPCFMLPQLTFLIPFYQGGLLESILLGHVRPPLTPYEDIWGANGTLSTRTWCAQCTVHTLSKTQKTKCNCKNRVIRIK